MTVRPLILSGALLLLFRFVPLAQEFFQPASGAELAQQMRQTRLLNYERISGTLQTRGRNGRRIVQNLVLKTQLQAPQWQSVFELTPPGTGNLTRLTIIKGGVSPPRYLLATGQAPPVEITPETAMTPLAGTDFWPADLGLGFFHWPRQTLLTDIKIRMRKGIACYVLESRQEPELEYGYTRVRSWISRNHGGLIYAEAYDRKGKRLKKFEISDVEKIDGQWKIKELRIHDYRARSTTKLSFDN